MITAARHIQPNSTITRHQPQRHRHSDNSPYVVVWTERAFPLGVRLHVIDRHGNRRTVFTFRRATWHVLSPTIN